MDERRQEFKALKSLDNERFKEIIGNYAYSGEPKYNLFRFNKESAKLDIIIYTRHQQKGNNRYRLGFNFVKLKEAAYVVVWIENTAIFVIPAQKLLEVYNAENKIKLGKKGTLLVKGVWQVNFYADTGELAPSGSNGYKYSVSEYKHPFVQ